MHTNPFTPAGYDIRELERKIHEKLDRVELYALRSHVADLERTVGELRSEIDGLRRRCEVLEESNQATIDQYHQDNGQFGVGA